MGMIEEISLMIRKMVGYKHTLSNISNRRVIKCYRFYTCSSFKTKLEFMFS